MALFEKYKVFNHREMHSRYEIGLEQYALTVGVEARLTWRSGTTSILPAAVRYQTELAVNVGALEGRRGRAGHHAARRGRADDRRAAFGARDAEPALADERRARVARRGQARPGGTAARDGRGACRSRHARGASSPTTCGRCRPTRRCSSSCSQVELGVALRSKVYPMAAASAVGTRLHATTPAAPFAASHAPTAGQLSVTVAR